LKVVFADEADDDLAQVVSYLADHNVEAAAQFIHDILDLAQRLADRMFEGPLHTLPNGQEVRSWPLPPYRIIYQRTPEALVVLHIADLRRQTP
jgi:plasmid stabilization system protein ParE